MSDSKAEKKGWYPGKFIGEMKEKRRSREMDKATIAAASAAAAAAAAPDSPVAATGSKFEEEVAASEPAAPFADPLAAAPAVPAHSEAAAAAITTTTATTAAEDAAMAAVGQGREQEGEEGEAEEQGKEGWVPGKFINKARERRAAAKAAKHESAASADLSAQNEQLDDGQQAEGKGTSSSEGWRPGKLIQQAKERRAQLAHEGHNGSGDGDDSDDDGDGGERKGRLFARLRERFVASRRRSERTRSVAAPTCQVTITVQDVRDVQATRPYLEVGLQGTTCHSPVFSPERGLDTPFTCSFSISDITTDVYLYVMEEYTVLHQNNCVGQVILPLVRYLTIKEALPPRSEWVEIFPLGPEGIYGKHRSGVEKVPGSAMPHVPSPLGYVQVQVELHLTDPAAKAYFEGEVFDLRDMHDDDRDEDGDVQIVPRVMKYNAARLKRALSAPPLLKLLTTFPGSLVLVTLGILLPLFGQPWHLPWLISFAIIANGALVKTERTFNHVILWDNEVGKSDKSALGKLRQLKGLFGALQQGLGKIATLLEKNSNLWSWADPQVTMLAVGVLLGVCFVLSLFMRLVPLRAQLLLVSLAVTGSVFAKSVKPPAANTAVEDSAAAAPNPIKARINNFMQRVPDGLELEHRYICETAIERGHKYAAKRHK